MQFKKILVPIDGSEHSLRALRAAQALATCQGATVTLLHCYDRIPMLIGGEPRQELTQELLEEGRKLMEPYAGVLSDAGMTPEIMVREGRPGHVIVEEARNGGFDLLVMGSRGLSDFEGMLLGSVAHRVLSAAHCPVLVTR